ncbi:MAG TPA: SdrD B-like domain-containing protein [Candidatus Limnocylindria bacterium]|nr:SdrD B-like domain-containing protein [Candidatus Limnocylindria bacterium]
MTKPLRTIALGLLFAALLLPFLTWATQGQPASVNGYVFYDGDMDGLRGPAERPVEGAEVILWQLDGGRETLAASARSDAMGDFTLQAPGAGEYRLEIRLPGDLRFTVPASGGSRALPSQGGVSRTPAFTLTGGEAAVVPVGATQRSAYLNVVAFGDENANGGRFSSEPLLRDVEIRLLYEWEGEQYVVASTMTDREGFAQLRDLTPARYRMEAVLPEPYIAGPLGEKLTSFYNTVLPAGENRGVTEPFDLQRSIALGVGGIQAGSVSGAVWHDADLDGRKGAAEGAFPGIRLTLIHKTLGLTQTLTTGNDPTFRFGYLQPGDYILTADLPDGMMFAPAGTGSAFTDGYDASASIQVTVSPGQGADAGTVGVMAASTVTVVAFHDTDADGIPEAGEPAFSGALVEAMEGGVPMAKATTDAHGHAVLPRVRHGSAEIRVTLPGGQVFSTAHPEGNAFASLRAASSLSATVLLAPGGAQTLYAGVTLPASVSGMVFDDGDLSGKRGAGEGPLAGFRVAAITQDGRAAAEMQTGEDGAYLLDRLVPGTYTLRVVPPSPYVFSGLSETGVGTENAVAAQSPEYGETLPFTLSGGEERENLDAGAFRSAVIAGSVLLGDEELGMDGSLGGLGGVLVELLDENGIAVSEHTTARTLPDGSYSLKGALPGTYALRYTLPDGAKFSSPVTDARQLLSGGFTVRSSEELAFPPLFAVRTGAFSGTVFHDSDNDNAFDAGDQALSGAEVMLTNLRTGEIYEAASGDDGAFAIEGVRPGRYTLRAALPEGFALDYHPNNPLGASLSGSAEAEFTVRMGEATQGRMLPAVRPVRVSGYSFYDNDLDGIYLADMDTPFPTSFTLTHVRTGARFDMEAGKDGAYTLPAAFPGPYTFRVALPEDHFVSVPRNAARAGSAFTGNVTLTEETAGMDLAVVQWGSLSGSVWNLDGSATHVAGIPVTLYTAKGAQVASAVSGADGSYSFEKLLPGSYMLHAELPEGYRFARERDTAARVSAITAEAAGRDSAKGSGDAFPLAMGERKAGQDVGIGAMGRLGDFAWLDLDRDGMQDAGEPGFPGIEVVVYQYGEEVARAVTDAYGYYSVNNLYPGAYVVEAKVPAGVRPTAVQTEYPLVASILGAAEGGVARSGEVRVPGGGRNLAADLGFAPLDGTKPETLFEVPQKDWTRVNEQRPSR